MSPVASECSQQRDGLAGMPLLEIRDLRTYFYSEDGVVPAVDGVSLSVGSGRTLGVVGESGCGKSVMSLSVMRLIPTAWEDRGRRDSVQGPEHSGENRGRDETDQGQ